VKQITTTKRRAGRKYLAVNTNNLRHPSTNNKYIVETNLRKIVNLLSKLISYWQLLNMTSFINSNSLYPYLKARDPTSPFSNLHSSPL
jgi:hypothetical protein